MDAGRTMQRRVERTVVVVFFTLLFEAVYACMYAFCFSGFNLQPQCGECGECKDVATVMSLYGSNSIPKSAPWQASRPPPRLCCLRYTAWLVSESARLCFQPAQAPPAAAPKQLKSLA